MANTFAAPVDTDADQSPDYLDSDSDNDGVPDIVEGQNTNGNGVADITPIGNDADGDGLDDVYDIIPAPAPNNAVGANLALIDTDNDTQRNWQDVDDDGDGIATAVEGAGDTDGDGIPDYSDPLTTLSTPKLFLPLVAR